MVRQTNSFEPFSQGIALCNLVRINKYYGGDFQLYELLALSLTSLSLTILFGVVVFVTETAA